MGTKFEKGMWCEICETGSETCTMVGMHLRLYAKGLTVWQEMLFGKFEEERRADVVTSREAREFKWVREMMTDRTERETAREQGRAVAVGMVSKREEAIVRMTCDVFMVTRKVCDNVGVNFSGKREDVVWCNEVRCSDWSAWTFE